MKLFSILLLLIASPTLAVEPTDWPYCCVADIKCGSAGGSATLIGIAPKSKMGIAGTAAHVVTDSNSVTLTFPDGYKCQGTVVGRSSALDLAAVRFPVKEGMTTPLGIRAVTKDDTNLIAVGYPYYCQPGKPHWTQGKSLGYSQTDIHFKAKPYIHSGFSGGALFSPDGYYLGSTNGYGEGYSYAASGSAMVNFFSRWVTMGAK